MAKVEVQPNGCWHFTGFINKDGYGLIAVRSYLTRCAHIVSYELHVGPVPRSLQLDHTCHRPQECQGGKACYHRRCVNPNHLEPVTKEENQRRGCKNPSGIIASAKAYRAKQAAKTHCPSGHEYTAENTLHAKNGRTCRECNRTRARERMRLKFGWKPRVAAANGN